MRENQEGQSTIEFLVSMIFVLGFVFLFLRISIIYTNGYLVHYATFSAARSYMVFHMDSNQPDTVYQRAATDSLRVFKSFNLESFIADFPYGQFKTHNADPAGGDFNNNLYIGNWVEYKDGFSVPGNPSGRINLNLRSEAFLGKEPPRSECAERTCDAIGSATGAGGNCKLLATLYDNGC
jgi:hypothetical protein